MRATLAPILSAEWIWLRRWKGESPGGLPAGWDRLLVTSIRSAWEEIDTEREDWLAAPANEDLDRVVAYRNTRGESYSRTIWPMLRHVINHSSYDRGQLTPRLPVSHGNAAADLLHDLEVHRPRVGLGDSEITVHIIMHSIYGRSPPLRPLQTCRRDCSVYAVVVIARMRPMSLFELGHRRERCRSLRCWRKGSIRVRGRSWKPETCSIGSRGRVAGAPHTDGEGSPSGESRLTRRSAPGRHRSGRRCFEGSGARCARSTPSSQRLWDHGRRSR